MSDNKAEMISNGMMDLLDPSLLQGLTEDQKQEALSIAAAAKRAEERAEQRALEEAIRRKAEERKRLEQELQEKQFKALHKTAQQPQEEQDRLVFIPKRIRHNQDNKIHDNYENKPELVSNPLTTSKHAQQQPTTTKPNPVSTTTTSNRLASSSSPTKSSKGTVRPPNVLHHRDLWLTEKELVSVKESYLGKSGTEKEEEVAVAKRKKQRATKKITFKFRWEDEEDTFDDNDPLYNATTKSSQPSSLPPPQSRTTRKRNNGSDSMVGNNPSDRGSVLTKPLSQMTPRDWRILRENYEITVKGGKAPPPMRSFRESPSPGVISDLHPALLESLEQVFQFREPSPIQRQAIPIGLQRRDLIGIAETGSGKTIAFGVPLCQYILNLPKRVLQSVANEGPLGLVMAPTRELALQIDGELQKLLACQRTVITGAVVGGQSIQQQAQMIRKGMHIIVGTPGRLNECIEMAYLVLNQCCYLVLDEADRMIDMGFAPQIESILDSMGGTLKSEQEDEAYRQEQEDLHNGDVARHRVTAMFSATMPTEVERLAKQYLRHPAVVSIGDEDSVKNARITQRIIFLSSPAHKEQALREQLNDPRFLREKVLVFVNEKKHADQVGRIVERSGRSCVVMHGGKSQEQREANLEAFRKGGVVMVATDVAGRGLDIPNVAQVINYDLPTRSIENYSHRIGRTGRAGKQGLATSFITEEDEFIMAPLKAYLESTGNTVPERLARHPAANDDVGGNLIY